LLPSFFFKVQVKEGFITVCKRVPSNSDHAAVLGGVASFSPLGYKLKSP
jgi:hypothetical protein